MKNKITLTVALSLVCLLQVVKAQKNNDSLALRTFGFGVNVQNFNPGNLYIYDAEYPTYTENYLFTFNIENVFRIEPEIGISTINDTSGIYYNPGVSQKITVINYGLTLAYMFQKGNVNFTPGIHLQTSSFTDTQKDPTNIQNPTSTITISMFGVGPELGAEYYFSKHFSFGAEISLIYTSITQKSSESSFSDSITTFNTSTGLYVRFFF